MHKQDENDLEILPSFIRRHVKILWNQFFCIYINLILTWILISAEKVYVFAGKAMGDFVNKSFILDASENN